MRLIDADAFKQEIINLWDWETVDGIMASTVLRQIIVDLDTATTVEERPTGHWEKTGTKIYHCSHCGCVDSIGFANFCWLCGADMRERETQPSTGKVEKTLTEAFMEDVDTDEVDYNELCYRTGHHLTMCDCELCDHRHECSGYEGEDDE